MNAKTEEVEIYSIEKELELFRGMINTMSSYCYLRARIAGWYTDKKTGEQFEPNKGERIALMHSELSEALEGIRKGLMDDKLPHRKMEEVELADTIIRILDYAGFYGFDLGGAIIEKLEYNAKREDHKFENRLKEGGKAF